VYADKFLCDLSLEEEEHISTRMTMVLDSETGQLCSFQKAGGTSVSREELAKALALCNARLKQAKLARAEAQKA
jgi:exosome complex RNA-binding protein Rrp42 (RNase PH superfamily)